MNEYEVTFRREGTTHQYIVTRDDGEEAAIDWAEALGAAWYVLRTLNVFGEFRRLI